jgi:hypothetical protein
VVQVVEHLPSKRKTLSSKCSTTKKRKVLYVSPRTTALHKELRVRQAPVLTPVILASREVEIGRITVQGQSGQIVCETPSPK